MSSFRTQAQVATVLSQKGPNGLSLLAIAACSEDKDTFETVLTTIRKWLGNAKVGNLYLAIASGHFWLALSLLQRSYSALGRTHKPITPEDCFSQYTAVAFSGRSLTVLAPLSVMCLQVSLKVQYKLFDISGGIYRFRLQGPCSIQTITLYTRVDLACNMGICCGDHRIKTWQ